VVNERIVRFKKLIKKIPLDSESDEMKMIVAAKEKRDDLFKWYGNDYYI